MLANFAVAALLLGQPDLQTVLAQADALYKTYQERGQAPAEKAALLEFFTEHDRHFASESAYLLAKVRFLFDLGEDTQALALWDGIPDEALTSPTDLANRLRGRFPVNPAAAVPLARRLGSVSRPTFVRWVHESLAQHYAPTVKDGVKTAAHDAFLAALAQSEPASSVTSAMRMWVEAQRTADVAHLRQLANEPITAPEAFAPRYQLLLAALLERRPELAAEGRALRLRVIASVRDELERSPSDDPKHHRDRYWLAYAFAAHADVARAQGDGDAELAALREAAAYSPDADDRKLQHLYRYEMATLAGQPEYRSAYAKALETAGRLDEALAIRTDIARLDAQMLPALQQLFARVRPAESFDRYWGEAQLAGRPTAPDFSLTTPSGSTVTLSSYRGRWVLLDFWGTWCEPCQREMPRIDAFAREYPGQILTLAVHDAATTVANYMRQRGYTFPVVIAPDEIERTFDVPYFPFKLLVAPDGRTLPVSNRTWEADVRRHLGR